MKSKLQHLLLMVVLALVASLWQGPQVQAAPDSEPMSFLFLGIDTGNWAGQNKVVPIPSW